jgi:hypothetical protein
MARQDLRAARAAEEAQSRRRQIEAEHQRQMEQQQQREREAEERRQEAERRARRDRARLKRSLEARESGSAVVDAYAFRIRETGRATRIKALLHNRMTLRDVLLLKEVLEPPRALNPHEDAF